MKAVFRAGDVLFGKLRPNLRKSVLASFDGICSTDILVLTPLDGLHPAFLSYLVHSKPFAGHAVRSIGGVNLPRTSWQALSGFVVKMPPLPEQRAIATTLRAVQDAREARRRELAIERERKIALMGELFTKGFGGEPLEQTVIGRLPRNWQVVPVGKLVKSLSGGTPSKANSLWWQGTIPWASPKDMKRPRLWDAEDHITEEAAMAASRIVPPKTLFIVVRGMILAKEIPIALTEVPMAFNQDMKAMTPNANVDSEFLLYALLQRKDEMNRLIGTSAHGTRRIGTASLEALPIPLPPQEEQKRIGQVLATCDEKIAALEEESSQHDNLFRGMLDELLTGRISTKPLIQAV